MTQEELDYARELFSKSPGNAPLISVVFHMQTIGNQLLDEIQRYRDEEHRTAHVSSKFRR